MRISDWSSDVCSSDLRHEVHQDGIRPALVPPASPGELCRKPTAGRHHPPGCERQHPPAPQQSRTHQEIPDQPRLLIPMRDKYGVSDDPHCWPGTSVLRNTLGIRDEATLADAEAEFAAVALQHIEIEAPPFDLDYLCRLHRQLFGDVYEWAGNLRSVDVSKGTTRFCTSGRIVDRKSTRLNSSH